MTSPVIDISMISTPLDEQYWLLWFPSSNQYSIVDTLFKASLDKVINAPSKRSFIEQEASEMTVAEAESIWTLAGDFLNRCQKPPEDDDILYPQEFPDITLNEKVYLNVHGSLVLLQTDDAKTLNLLLPSLASYRILETSESPQVSFSVFRAQGVLYLLKDGVLIRAVKQKAYHYIQGSFISLLTCCLQQYDIDQLIGSLHASTVVDEDSGNTFALIGRSGSGKSTLTALLAKHGYSVLADDVSALTSDFHILYNPNGLSIKSGAYQSLRSLYPELEQLPQQRRSAEKGPIRYLASKPPERWHYACRKLILVDYNPDAEEALLPIDRKTALHILIPESWISPTPEHAKAFMDWCSHLECYKLSYHQLSTALEALASLYEM